jgi:GntR family transcriptional regulator / MocR family aminotransferase
MTTHQQPDTPQELGKTLRARNAARKGARRSSLASLAGFWLDHDSTIPLRIQLYRQLRDAVLSRQLPAGTRLLATRMLASELNCARNTVLGAFEQLLAEGYLEARSGSGTYVVDILPEDTSQPNSPPQAISPRESRAGLSRLGETLASKGPSTGDPYQALAPCLPDVSLFPFDVWERLGRVWRYPPRSLSTQTDPCGYAPLREALCTYLRTARMIECVPEQILITTGARNGFHLAARLLLDIGDHVWVEDPGHLSLRTALAAAGATVVPIPVDKQGLSLAGRERARPPRMIAVAPSHQYPLGTVMSLERRLELISYAADVDSWIIEDDYDNEFRYTGGPVAALHSLDGGNRVIYIGTFSKVLFPALRLGFLVVPARIAERFALARAALDLQPPILPQPILEAFIREGYFASHVRRMRTTYHQRQLGLIDAIQSRLGDVLTVSADSAGMHLLAHLTPDAQRKFSDREASRRAAAHRVIAPPLSDFYADHRDGAALVLGYAAVPERGLVQAVQRMARALAL